MGKKFLVYALCGLSLVSHQAHAFMPSDAIFYDLTQSEQCLNGSKEFLVTRFDPTNADHLILYQEFAGEFISAKERQAKASTNKNFFEKKKQYWTPFGAYIFQNVHSNKPFCIVRISEIQKRTGLVYFEIYHAQDSLAGLFSIIKPIQQCLLTPLEKAKGSAFYLLDKDADISQTSSSHTTMGQISRGTLNGIVAQCDPTKGNYKAALDLYEMMGFSRQDPLETTPTILYLNMFK
ncbi:MAG: hypothetical protein BGO28_07075 [Alphaproteobacteria bacterium 43-37]|nr:MAG: hypothetical protein BGO28_07075 [Alphaproteobacteria bacterium 43-37]